MTELPLPLRPWASQLGLFSPDLAVSLGPQVVRLDAAVGPLRAGGVEVGGEHTGYAGLARRGPPERLLLSEWALALEHPDEFLRRAAMTEQSFLDPDLRRPRATRRCIALFDAGPSQLGSPRLAHLALLVVLARRAEAAGVRLEWAVLQRLHAGLHPGFEPAELPQLLEARSFEEPNDAHLSQARSLGVLPGSDEVWFVGGDSCLALAQASDCAAVRVEDPWSARADEVEVEVRPRRKAARSVRLPLPAPAARIRMLRDPFRVIAAEPATVGAALAHPTAFDFGPGRRLIYARADNVVCSVPVPQSPRAGEAPPPKRIEIPRRERILAAGWRKHGGLFAVSRDDSVLYLRGAYFGGAGAPARIANPIAQPHSPGLEARLPENLVVPLQQMFPFTSALVGPSRAGTDVLLRDATGNLVRLRVNEQQVDAVAGAVVAVTSVGERLVYVQFADALRTWGDDLHAVVCGDFAGQHAERLTLPYDANGGEAFFGFAPVQAHPHYGLCAVRVGDGRWRLLHGSGDHDVATEGREVIGVTTRWIEQGERPALITLARDRRSLVIEPRRYPFERVTSPDPIVRAIASAWAPNLAFLTEAGELIVVHTETREVLMRQAMGVTP